MKRLQKRLAGWGMALFLGGLSVFSVDRASADDKKSTELENRLPAFYSTVCSDWKIMKKYPNLCGAYSCNELCFECLPLEDKIIILGLYIEVLQQYRDILRRELAVLERREIKRKSIEIRDYLINYLETNYERITESIEMIPDRNYFRDRG